MQAVHPTLCVIGKTVVRTHPTPALRCPALPPLHPVASAALRIRSLCRTAAERSATLQCCGFRTLLAGCKTVYSKGWQEPKADRCRNSWLARVCTLSAPGFCRISEPEAVGHRLEGPPRQSSGTFSVVGALFIYIEAVCLTSEVDILTNTSQAARMPTLVGRDIDTK